MNWHVTEAFNGTVRAIFHVETPAGNNKAGLTWCKCVKCCGDYPTDTEAYQKDDLPDIKSGKIIEYRENFDFSGPGLTDAQKQAELEARYLIVADMIQDEVQMRLKYYGFEDGTY
jgi:hypothetical protein